MRLAPLSEVPDGTEVIRDVLAGRTRAPLLRAGVRLSPHYRSGLLRAGIHAVYVEDPVSEGISAPAPLLAPQTQERAARAVEETYAEAQAALHSRRPLDPAVGESLASVVEDMLGEVRGCGEVATVLRDLCAVDAYTFQHSIDVTALGLFVGAHVFAAEGWSATAAHGARSEIDERLHVLGLGLLLHDIGKLVVPTPILRKPGRLTAAERELVECHPQAGFDLLSGPEWSPLVKAIVLRHHERWDGSGYPGGLRGVEIHPMARIASVADVYDAVTSERFYSPARPAHDGVRAIVRGAGVQFDPAIAEVFRRVVAPFPPGVEVTLADGRRALVVEVPADALDRPRVRVLDGPGAPVELALAEKPELAIADWPPEAAPGR